MARAHVAQRSVLVQSVDRAWMSGEGKHDRCHGETVEVMLEGKNFREPAVRFPGKAVVGG